LCEGLPLPVRSVTQAARRSANPTLPAPLIFSLYYSGLAFFGEVKESPVYGTFVAHEPSHRLTDCIF
jgi:hypothetical protein